MARTKQTETAAEQAEIAEIAAEQTEQTEIAAAQLAKQSAVDMQLRAAIATLTTDSSEALLSVATLFSVTENRAMMRELFAGLTITKKVKAKTDYLILALLCDMPEETARVLAGIPAKGLIKLLKAVITIKANATDTATLNALKALIDIVAL